MTHRLHPDVWLAFIEPPDAERAGELPRRRQVSAYHGADSSTADNNGVRSIPLSTGRCD
jgi:hypothetical protein